jgi:hypothetical protein
MRLLKFAAAAAAGLCLAAAGAAASAATITYTLAGEAQGSFGDASGDIVSPFDLQLQFNFTGALPGATDVLSGINIVALTGGTVGNGGGTANVDFAPGGGFAIIPLIGLAAFGSADDLLGPAGPQIVFGSESLSGYDGFHNLAPTPVIIVGPDGTDGFRPFTTTSAGETFTLYVDHFLNPVFSASIAGVPEPGAWALMIMGFGAAGAVLRRRRALALA